MLRRLECQVLWQLAGSHLYCNKIWVKGYPFLRSLGNNRVNGRGEVEKSVRRLVEAAGRPWVFLPRFRDVASK